MPGKSKMLTAVFGCLALDRFKLKLQLLTSDKGVQVMLPKLAEKAHSGPTLVRIYQRLQAERPPQIGQRNVSPDRSQLDLGIKIKGLAARHKGVKRKRIEMVPMSWVVRP